MNENRPERPYLQFQNQMSRLETVLLLLYLPIHAFLMPTILGFLFQRAGISYSMMQLNVCYYALSTVIVFLLARRFLRRSFDVLCDRLWGVLFTVVIAYFLQQALMYLVAILELPLGISGDNQNNAAVQEMLQYGFGTMFGIVVFLAPITEEVLFRGAIFGTLRKRNRLAAYAVTILLFGLLHVWQFVAPGNDWKYLIHIIDYIPATWALCWVYERTGTIWSPIALHMLVNAISVTALRSLA